MRLLKETIKRAECALIFNVYSKNPTVSRHRGVRVHKLELVDASSSQPELDEPFGVAVKPGDLQVI